MIIVIIIINTVVWMDWQMFDLQFKSTLVLIVNIIFIFSTIINKISSTTTASNNLTFFSFATIIGYIYHMHLFRLLRLKVIQRLFND